MAKTGMGKKRTTQSEVVDIFSETTGMKRAQVTELFDELYAFVAREVKTNGEFVLPGFGKLKEAERKTRQGRNPANSGKPLPGEPTKRNKPKRGKP
jgi:nucleoid DNA-binding protein